ncbi:PE-PPE domain-containing protein [Rhodococcus sp. BH5]|uniref:PE-PPE domain-containing protein n=1 Tax=Rhodococcus sp. BH5 TaxID=2871702 RepID=UPI0022CD4549|nr:PE-PPE domain-containing protein [Rhodococcus sp. BH5]MCZ9635385.1 PE-PPE domain-containing protein [Rhodococcus sp. BH5]
MSRAPFSYAALLLLVMIQFCFHPSFALAKIGFTSADCSVPLVLAVDGTKSIHTPTSIDANSPLKVISYREFGDNVEHIEYPGGMVVGINGWLSSYDESVAIGIENLKSRLTRHEFECRSSSSYILLGYSQGARIVGDVASEIDTRTSGLPDDIRHRVQAYLYADPRQPITGIEVILSDKSPIPGITFSGERPPFAVVPVTWSCIPGDGVCDANPPIGLHTLIGYLKYHTDYASDS